MPPTFSMTAADDLLGLAVDDDIVLVDVDGGPVSQYVEVLNHDATWATGATTAIRPINEYTQNYELLDNDLVLPLGAAVNGDYIITSISATCSSERYPQVQVGFISFSDIAKFVARQTGTITVTGGFGLVNKWGATFSQGVTSRLSVSILTADALEETSGDFLAAGYTLYGFKQEIGVEAYDTITGPAGATAFVQGTPTRKSRDGWLINRWNGFVYMA